MSAMQSTPDLRYREPARFLPQQGKVYTLRAILDTLDLDDSPHLNLRLDDVHGPIQDSHLTYDELLSVPGLADTTWRYRFTTREWIPIFEYAGPADAIRACLDFEPDIDGRDEAWITPKGFPRRQLSIFG